MQESPLDFPKRVDQARIDGYTHYDQIYDGNQYDAFKIRRPKDLPMGTSMEQVKIRYIVANFGGLMSRVMADMLFSEPLTIDLNTSENQNYVDGISEQNSLQSQLYESALVNSRRGDTTFKLRIGKMHPDDDASTIIIEEFPSSIYFPTLSQDMTRNRPTEDIIATVFQRNNVTYLRKEIHTPGLITTEVYNYNANERKVIPGQLNPEDFGFKSKEETRVNRSLIFHIPNVRDGSGFWGTSDYKDLESLMYALNNRLSSVDKILDKHGDPILAVPPGVIDEEGKVRKEALGMYEVDNENPGFNKPEYIVWDANMEAAFKQVDKLMALLFMFSEISPSSSSGDDGQGGLVESGRALKFKLLATIRKKNRKKMYYDQAIKDMLTLAQDLGKAWAVSINGVTISKSERPALNWPDGVINDEVEQVDIEVNRVDAGLSSRADSISRLDGISPDDAKKKVKEIDAESTPPAVPAVDNNLNGGGTGGAGDAGNTNAGTGAPQGGAGNQAPGNKQPKPQPPRK